MSVLVLESNGMCASKGKNGKIFENLGKDTENLKIF